MFRVSYISSAFDKFGLNVSLYLFLQSYLQVDFLLKSFYAFYEFTSSSPAH